MIKVPDPFSLLGNRIVFTAPGTNSSFWTDDSSQSTWSACDLGHQGLIQDEEVELIQNRNRELIPVVGIFAQRDKVINLPVINLYIYIQSHPQSKLDPFGLAPIPAGSDPNYYQTPWVPIGSGFGRMTIYYGPWACPSAEWKSCENECNDKGQKLKGCIWIADVYIDTKVLINDGSILAGGVLRPRHCCCDCPVLSKEDTEDSRDKWDDSRSDFQKEWSRMTGAPFPTFINSRGLVESWPVHHIEDLKHGGNPTEFTNLLPVPPKRHYAINAAYPACYNGKGGFGSPAATDDLPYTKTVGGGAEDLP